MDFLLRRARLNCTGEGGGNPRGDGRRGIPYPGGGGPSDPDLGDDPPLEGGGPPRPANIYACGGYGSRCPEKAVMGMRLWGYMHAGAMEVGVQRRLSRE